MLTDEDVRRLIEVFATKEDIKEIAENLVKKEDFVDLQTAIDAYAGKADSYFQEMVIMSHKVERLEKWLHQVAEKVGIKLEY
jgi:hypothetical protein